MRKSLRSQSNRNYWDQRWTEGGADADFFHNPAIYPIKYAEEVMQKKHGRTAELGCGLGRIVKHYHNKGRDILGIDRSRIALERIRKDSGKIKLLVADVSNLPFKVSSFDTILAFGLYHNIENGMLQALKGSLRCLKPGGWFCISMRPDNFEMRFNEIYWRFKKGIWNRKVKEFHKWLVEEKEFKEILEGFDCVVESVSQARNVSILWRVPLLREKNIPGNDSEAKRRSEGYQLNLIGRRLDGLLRGLFPCSFCNVLVFMGRKIL